MVSEEFKQNVESGNIISVRSALADYLIADRTFAAFDESLRAAKETLPVLEKYDGKPFEEDQSRWDKDYLNGQKVALMVNFSEERIDHLKKVIQKVLSEDKAIPQAVRKNSLPEEKTDMYTAPSRRTGRRIISVTETSGRTSRQPGQAVQPGKKTGKKTSTRTNPKENIPEGKRDRSDLLSSGMVVGGLAVAAAGGVAAVAGAGGISYVFMAAGAGTAGIGIYNKMKK